MHWSDIGNTLLKFKDDGFMCDTVLIANNGELKAHGIVLAAICPPCKRAFENDSEIGIHRLDFPDLDIDTLKVILHFAYTGKLVLPLKESQKEEVSQMFATLQSLEIDIRRFNGSEIKFCGSGDGTGNQNTEGKPRNSETSAIVTKQEAFLNHETIYISISEAQDVADEEQVKPDACIVEPSTQQYVTTADGKQQIILECSSEIDAQQYEIIQNFLSTGIADGLIENGVVSEHSYYSFDAGQQKLGELRSVAVKTEGQDEQESSRSSSDDTMLDDEDECEENNCSSIKCPFCNVTFETKESIQSHFSSNHDNITAFKCNKCLRKFSSAYSLAKHANSVDGCKHFLCEVCGESFVQKWSMKEHAQSHQVTEFIYLCPFCQLSFTTPKKLRQHCSVAHKVSGKDFDESEIQPIQVFDNETGALIVSQESDDVTRPYLCDVCGRSFKTSWSLKNHERIHSGISSMKTYSCPLCSKTFFHKSQFLQHMVRHSGTKPHACSVCSKSYSQKGSLTQHMRTHSGERPFACMTCGKTFVIKAMLMQHIRVHTGEKPHTCSVCGKSFIYKESLIVHLRIHTGEKPYRCNVCNKSYTQSHHLKGHMLTHTGEKPYACTFCDKAYKNRVDLRFHCQRVHQINISKRQMKSMKTETVVA